MSCETPVNQLTVLDNFFYYVLVSHRQDAWTDLVFNLHLDAAVFVRKHINDFMTALKNSSTLSAVSTKFVLL